MRLLSAAVLGGALIAVGLAAPATGEATATRGNRIAVEPDVARPGQRIELEVRGCAAGTQRHWAGSPAFTGDATLGGRNDQGRTVARLRRDIKPGTHTVVAHCGQQTFTGHFKVSNKISWPVRLSTDIESPTAN
ncbi:hypothetical protein [Actinomadura xylanilytica]|uniref:hypothetical protein n=1 Tax=Actinomadura xylanilytica TaxID=887459 RepID=UPI00255B05A7|nr:hypothetical protein [Actinomadura xylanilytica]MDL4777640.1 hypothetical protein [Actinomadura xylanilytica]